MSCKKEVIIHLGLHKTASSFLQKVFFKAHSEALGFIDLRKELVDLRNYIIFTNDLDWDSSHAEKLFENACRNSGSRIFLSEEMFCGNPYSNCMNRKTIINRLHELFPNAKYLLVLRNPKDLTKSLYLQYIKKGGCCSMVQFLNDRNDQISFSLGAYLNFDAYLKYIVNVAGKNRVKCLLYEDMIYNPKLFFSELSSFIGLIHDYSNFAFGGDRVNRSMNPSIVPLQRFFNQITASPKNPYNLLPQIAYSIVLRTCMVLSRVKHRNFSDAALTKFIKNRLPDNYYVKSFLDRDIDSYGY